MFVELADEGALSFRTAVPAQVVCPDRVPAAGQVRADMAVAAAIQSVLVEFARARGADDRQALLRAMSREHRAGRNERAERGETRRSRDPSRRPNNGDGSPSAEPR